jgi:hypothetical protein
LLSGVSMEVLTLKTEIKEWGREGESKIIVTMEEGPRSRFDKLCNSWKMHTKMCACVQEWSGEGLQSLWNSLNNLLSSVKYHWFSEIRGAASSGSHQVKKWSSKNESVCVCVCTALPL